jgi:hypothetical protein
MGKIQTRGSNDFIIAREYRFIRHPADFAPPFACKNM